MNNNYPFYDINSFTEWIENQKRFSKKTSLEKMFFICQLLGNPEKKFLSIHVTGTNGKGSVVSYLRSILMNAGYHVGTYTSPYILKFNERICFDNQMISDEDVLKIAQKIYDLYPIIINSDYEIPTFFEFVTLMGFIYFSEIKNLDYAIIEVGIGGLLDSTNVITPLISAITNVAFDHMNVLGNTLSEILKNKMGIVKANIPAIIGITDADLLNQANEEARIKNTQCYFPLLKKPNIIKCDMDGSTFDFGDHHNVTIRLPGFHQIENAIIAIQVIECFNKINPHQKVSEFDLKEGLAKTTWPGRFEVLSKEPLIIVDGAHNIDGITRITDFIETLTYHSKRCIFACSADKEKVKMLMRLERYFDEIIFTAYTYKRHSDATELYNCSSHVNKKLVLNIDEVIEQVMQEPAALNLFVGSLYFVSEVRPKILQRITEKSQ